MRTCAFDLICARVVQREKKTMTTTNDDRVATGGAVSEPPGLGRCPAERVAPPPRSLWVRHEPVRFMLMECAPGPDKHA